MLGKYNNNYFKCIAEFSRKKGGTYKNKEETEIRVATIADVVTNLGVGRAGGRGRGITRVTQLLQCGVFTPMCFGSP